MRNEVLQETNTGFPQRELAKESPLMAQQAQPQHTSSVTAASFPPRASSFVGRQEELTRIVSHYAAARRGQTHVVLVAGAPGIGKTRLLDAIAGRAAHDGAVVLCGGGLEVQGKPPFLPLLEARGRHNHVTSVEQRAEPIPVASP